MQVPYRKMKIFMPLFLCFSFLGEALTLDCYKCDSSINESCIGEIKKTITCNDKEMGTPINGRHLLCAIMRVTDNHKLVHALRGCLLDEGNLKDNCFRWAKKNGFLNRITGNITSEPQSKRRRFCVYCKSDKCNSVTRMIGSVSLSTVATVMVLMFFNY